METDDDGTCWMLARFRSNPGIYENYSLTLILHALAHHHYHNDCKELKKKKKTRGRSLLTN